MASLIGQYCLLFGIFANIFAVIFCQSRSSLYRTVIISFLLLTISFFSLLYDHIILDVSVINVYKSVNRYLPIFYRMGASWGNHEGSMLLWCYIITCYQLYNVHNLQLNNNQIIYSNKILSIISIVFCCYTYISSNPFLLTYNELLDDKELNPVLQDPILIIHPPIIYVGYLGSILIYSYSLSAFKELNNLVLLQIKKIAVFSWTLLSIGILLGSWWAYHELGWGGWWFWDPVENISLLPWIFLLLVIHNVSYTLKYGKVTRSLYLFSILTFISSCYGTFFVRSGLITSIHSFASDSSRGVIILLSLVFFIMLSIVLYVHKQEKPDKYNNYVLYLYNTLMLLLLFVILLGTIFPSIYLYLLTKEISIGASFYNDIIVPWSLLFLTLMLLYGQKNWILQSTMDRQFITFNVLSLVIYIYNIYTYIHVDVIYQLLILIILLNINNIVYSGIRYVTFNYREFAHLGFNISLLGMVLSSNLEYEVIINSFPGESLILGKYLVIIKDINVYQSNSYYSLYANVLLDNGNEIVSMIPEKRLYLSNLSVISKSVINSNYLNDLYTLIGEGNDINGWYFRIYISHFINLLWLGGFLIGIGYIIK